MKKLVILAAIVVAALLVWNRVQQGGSGNETLAELQQRLDAAEQSFQQAGRAAGVSGVDTSADADRAVHEVEQVERELRDLGRTSPSAEDKEQIDALLARAEDLKRKMG